MSILDRTIAKSFLINTLMLFVILFCLIVTIDASFNIDRFWGNAGQQMANAGREDNSIEQLGRAVLLALDLWWPRLLLLYNFLLGVVMVGAAGFTCAQMARQREFIAVMASGVSLHRLALPILAGALLLILAQAVNQEFFLPRVAPLLTRDHGDAGKHDFAEKEVLMAPDAQGRIFYVRRFDADTGKIRDLCVIERDTRGRATRTLQADLATWDSRAWTLHDARMVSSDSSVLATGDVHIETDLGPTALRIRQYSGYAHNLGTATITSMLERGSMIEDRVEKQLRRVRAGRPAVMAINILALLITLPFYLTRQPPRLIAQTLRCAPVAALALIGGVVGPGIDIQGLSPALSVFVPALILAPVAVAMMASIKT